MPEPHVRNELILSLENQERLRSQGVRAELAGIRNVAITRGRHFLGMWRRGVAAYDWIPAGYSAPQYRAASADEAARYTVQAFCQEA